MGDEDLREIEGAFDLILLAFPFDNIPGVERRRGILSALRDRLTDEGRIVLLGSAPEIYTHEWVSFTTSEFPANRTAGSGDPVQIIMKDVDDRRPVLDQIWFHHDYTDLFESARLRMLAYHQPLGREEDPVEWITETSIAPWVIYVLGRKTS